MPRSSHPLRAPWRRIVLLALVLGVGVTSHFPPAAATRELDPKAGWVVRCRFVRHLPDDPIVFPRDPGAAHLHAFFGNRGTDANSTYRSLRQGRTSCGLAQDKAAYWFPAVYEDGRRVEPLIAAFYYRNRTAPASAVRPFPPGLKIIAGRADAASPQPTSIVYWDCDNGGPDQNRDHPVDCGSGIVSANIRFPDCWDGRHRDTRRHRRHMAYSIDPNDDGSFECPRTHPIAVPRLTYSLQFPVNDGRTISLSSGSPHTMHADFINAWVQQRLRRLVRRCIGGQENCGSFGLGDRATQGPRSH